MQVYADDIGRAGRWWAAIGLATLIHVAWMSVFIWYQKLLEGAIWCCNPDAGCGGFLSPPECPVPRPHAAFVGWALLLAGMVASAYVPARVLRLPNNLSWWIGAIVGVPVIALFLMISAIVLAA